MTFDIETGNVNAELRFRRLTLKFDGLEFVKF